ncbi:MAG: hypothetical protein DHS20C20_26190 [Ardenticatenaceae bacterium]|nr:MAG: hypothetical protein DHS20C20_26190 [Ardenticatenaceae bacterium]
MILIPDTNLLVRLLTGDDPQQFQQAKATFAQSNILIPTTIVLETEWVLRYAYKFGTVAIMDAFEALFGLPNITLAEPNRVRQAMVWANAGLDFADSLHLATVKQDQQFATFDKKLIAKAKRLTDKQLVSPAED